MRGGSTEPKSVSKSTYHRHTQFRNAITPMPEFLTQHGIATTSSHSAATVPTTCPRDHRNSVIPSQGDLTRGRSHSPIAGPSEQPNKRQRPNEEVIGSGPLSGENGEGQQVEGSHFNGSIDPEFMQVQLHVSNRMKCRYFLLTMPISQLPPGTPSEVREPDNEEDNSAFNSNNMNQSVRLFDYHHRNELKIKFHSRLQVYLHFVHLQLRNVIAK